MQRGLSLDRRIDKDLNLVTNTTPPFHESAVLASVYSQKLDFARFIAICSIVWGHAVIVIPPTILKNYSYIHSFVLQSGKVGTVMFFIISGFFLNRKIETFTVPGYLRYRTFSLIVPWISCLSLYILILIIDDLAFKEVVKENAWVSIKSIVVLYKDFIFYTSYWFIPIAILSSCILIVFKNFINKMWFGLILLCITLFYDINFYYNWVSALHTKAIFGYVFFVWLGIQINAHLKIVDILLQKISWKVVVPLLIVGLWASCYEGWKLSLLGSADSYASLRFSNAIFSVVLFFSILKFKDIDWLNYLHPRKYVFGIYLIHCIVISMLKPKIEKVLLSEGFFDTAIHLLIAQVLLFVFLFSLVQLIVIAIKESRFSAFLGR
ncbi:MAG: acyltransferase [Bacteroidota bacterium]